MDIPASGTGNTFLSNAQIQGDGRAALDKILQVLEQGYGLTQGEEELTVAAGTLSPAPTRQMMSLTHASASQDLVSIQNANIPAGRLIHVRISNGANVVVLKHGAGAQQLSMANGVDYTLSLTTMGVTFIRRGSLWVEVGRSATPGLLTTATLSGTWAHSANALRYRTVGTWCHVFGAVTNSGVISSTSALFTLPVSFRSATLHYFHAILIKSGDDQPATISVNGGTGVVSFEPLNGQGYAVGDTLGMSFGFPILN